MSDEVDLAQRHEELRRGHALGAVLIQAEALQAPGLARCCTGCGEPLDPDRLQAAPGARRCLECQEAQERRRRMFRGGRV